MPILAAIGPRSVSEEQTLTIVLSASDPDGDSLVYNASGLPEGATFQGNRFQWIPRKDQEGTHRLTFSVSDGQLYDSENVTITVYVDDTVPPKLSLIQPEDAAIQVPINTVVTLGIEDAGEGVDEASVRITINGQVVYAGTTDCYISHLGNCYRSGSHSSYRYVYQPADPFFFDQQVTVTAQAADYAGNTLPAQRFSFTTAMRSFGRNRLVSGAETFAGAVSAAVDSEGCIWSAWHRGEPGQRRVMLSRWDPDMEDVEILETPTVPGDDSCCPTLVIDERDRMTLAWQAQENGQWDIYVSSSADRQLWTGALRVSDPNGDQTAPVLAVDSEGDTALAWVDERDGQSDIYLARGPHGLADRTTARITHDVGDQLEPSLAMGPQGRVYLCWTDLRAGQADIYGTHSGLGWAPVALVAQAGQQRLGRLAVSPRDEKLHCVWTDDRHGHRDVYYGTMTDFSVNGLLGIVVNDDGSAADQSDPVLALGQDPQGGEAIHISWVDDRHREVSGDTDLFYAEIHAGAVATNVLVGDDDTNSDQFQPDLLVDDHGQPVMLWSDARGGAHRVYGAGITHVSPTVLYQAMVSAAVGGLLGADPERIGDEDDVSMQLPPGAYGYDITYTVASIQNVPHFDSDYVSGYEIGPSGLQFHHPVTVTVPYRRHSVSGPPVPYWFDEQTSSLRQEGISDVVYWHVSDELGVLQFKTTHLTSYYVLEGKPGASAGAGGGGCVLVPAAGRPSDLLVPALLLSGLLFILYRRDRRARVSQRF